MSFLIAFALGLVLTPLAERLGRATGMTDRPAEDGLKLHDQPVPVLGGVAVVAGALGATAILGDWLPAAVVAAVLVMLGAGMLDDARPLPPWPRVVLQAGAGGILVASGLRLDPLGILGGVGVVALVVACTNAVNLVDGQDGLAAGQAAIAALGLAALAAAGGPSVEASLGLATAGALFGFLIWNRPPARIFLGNGGAYAVGALLAVLAAGVSAAQGWHGLLAAALCLGVFVFELAFTTFRRLRAGSRVSSGDRLHSYDLASHRFGSRPLSTLLFWAVGALLAGLALVVAGASLVVGVVLTVACFVAASVLSARLWTRRGAEAT
jgi:UDP-GlcNAc:undecaprenyl-phosphate/decaprenyl-phosphate GlcNAc-1-phosphate transferase